ncbi:MAG: zf-HC2 domain-containing protein [Oscillospiraceae bacterium]|nr:zf-HC2 domain-containing protein [Oscillospiraceae bacterium]
MKSCEQYELLASLVLDGEATGEEQAELAAHLETCPACRAYAEDIRRIHKVFACEDIAVPAGFAVRVMDRVRDTAQDRPGKEPKKVYAFPRWQRWTALAACCAMVILGVWTSWRTGVKDSAVSTDIGPRMASDTSGGAVNAAPAAQEPDVSGVNTDEDADMEPLNEAPPELPEEYQELAKSAIKDGEEEGLYQPLVNGDPEPQQPGEAAAPPVYAANSGASDTPLPSEADGLDYAERDNAADGAEPALEPEPQPEPEDGSNQDAPASVEPGSPEESVEPADAVEPVEVIGVPEPGIVIAYGTAAQGWVENVMGLEWAIGGSYPLTAEQYGDLLQTLDEAGEAYSIASGEDYCLMTE